MTLFCKDPSLTVTYSRVPWSTSDTAVQPQRPGHLLLPFWKKQKIHQNTSNGKLLFDKRLCNTNNTLLFLSRLFPSILDPGVAFSSHTDAGGMNFFA